MSLCDKCDKEEEEEEEEEIYCKPGCIQVGVKGCEEIKDLFDI